MANVNDLLQRSRQAHERFHARHRYLGQGKREPGSPEVGKAAITEARALRVEAHEADPTHQDAAWLEDRVPHDEILAFYDGFLATH